jgi:hypothetical protein
MIGMKGTCDNRDACNWIENWCQERGCIECEWHKERDHDYYGPYYDLSQWQHSPVGGCNEGGSRISLMT